MTEDESPPGLGMNHPTTIVDAKKEGRSLDRDEGFYSLDALVYVHDDGSYELAALEYDNELLRGLDALELYMEEFESLYGDEFHDDGYGTGDLVWGDVKEVLEQ